MESGKQGSSETSSEENDRQEQLKEDTGSNNSPTKRSYECTFCKRGFTNAQALGGHMNIHRKDRAKAKHVTTNSSKSYVQHTNFVVPPQISSEPSNCHPVLEDPRTNYHMYFQAPASGPRGHPSQYGYHHGSDLVMMPRSSSSSHHHHHQSLRLTNEELGGANLSLRLGSNHVENRDVIRGVPKEDEVDLELRLGHDP